VIECSSLREAVKSTPAGAAFGQPVAAPPELITRKALKMASATCKRGVIGNLTFPGGQSAMSYKTTW
jgi:hypothetical protein